MNEINQAELSASKAVYVEDMEISFIEMNMLNSIESFFDITNGS